MTELRISLIVRTESITLSELTAVLGLAPSRGHSRGDVPHGGRLKHFQTPLPHTSWILYSDEDVTAPLHAHLRALAKRLPPEDFQSLRAKLPFDLRVEVSIGASYNGQAAYIRIAPVALEIVMAYGATLLVDAYYAEDEENEPIEGNAETG
ncbi:MAG: DUF4279 domain-containing protein [Acidobacteriota bacterium]